MPAIQAILKQTASISNHQSAIVCSRFLRDETCLSFKSEESVCEVIIDPRLRGEASLSPASGSLASSSRSKFWAIVGVGPVATPRHLSLQM